MSMPDTNDLTWRLRSTRWHGTDWGSLMFEAADEIARLRASAEQLRGLRVADVHMVCKLQAEIERLRAALQAVVEWDDQSNNPHFEAPCEEEPKVDDDDICLWCGADPTQGCQWHKDR